MGGNWDGEHRRNYFLYGGYVKHPFFDAIEYATKVEKRAGAWGVGTGRKIDFYRALTKAHPFVFDRKTTFLKRQSGRTLVNFEDIVGEFSLPFKTSLYLLTDAPLYQGPMDVGEFYNVEDSASTVIGYSERLGYLIDEITPERFMVFEVSWLQQEFNGKKVPAINQYELNLTDIQKMLRDLEALRSVDENIRQAQDRRPETHVFKETGVILELSKAISVKRIGIERMKSFSIKTNIGTGYTSVKTPNLYHIADKEEYEYTKALCGGDIRWEWSGFWRGHWRAFYCKDSNGKHVRDSFGRNVVDYNRVGKDRAGEYNTPGYTWIKEHIKGDPKIAEIKTHYVVNK